MKIQINIRKYGLACNGKVQIFTNWQKCLNTATKIAYGIFPQTCEIFDYDTGALIQRLN